MLNRGALTEVVRAGGGSRVETRRGATSRRALSPAREAAVIGIILAVGLLLEFAVVLRMSAVIE
jgi:hypothetical protein